MNLQEKVTASDSIKVKLFFKDGESALFSYSKLKRFDLFRTKDMEQRILKRRNCDSLKEFTLKSFKAFLKMVDDGKTLAENGMLNYFDYLGENMQLAVLLQPNSIFNPANLTNSSLDTENLNLLAEIRQKIALKKENRTANSNNLRVGGDPYACIDFIPNIPGFMASFISALNLEKSNKGLGATLGFIATYSKINAVNFIFDPYFSLFVKIETESLMNPKHSAPKNIINIFFFSKTTGAINLDTYKDNIDFIINIYKQRLDGTFEVFCKMSKKIANKNSKRLLDFLKDNYNLEISKSACASELRSDPSFKCVAEDLSKSQTLGIWFKEPNLLKLGDSNVDFFSIKTSDICETLAGS